MRRQNSFGAQFHSRLLNHSLQANAREIAGQLARNFILAMDREDESVARAHTVCAELARRCTQFTSEDNGKVAPIGKTSFERNLSQRAMRHAPTAAHSVAGAGAAAVIWALSRNAENRMIALDEDYVGVDDDILFVNVQSCMALVAIASDGRLGGMHMTAGTRQPAVAKAAEIFCYYLRTVNRLVCIGNTVAFGMLGQRDPAMLFPGRLGVTLPGAFLGCYSGSDAVYYSTSDFYKSTSPATSAAGGVVVHAWRDAGTGQVQFAFGDHTSCEPLGLQTVSAPVFRISSGNYVAPKGDKKPFAQVSVIDVTVDRTAARKTSPSTPPQNLPRAQLTTYKIDRTRMQLILAQGFKQF